jgi:hypothetical protein
VVGDPLSLDDCGTRSHKGAQPEVVEGAYGVAGQVDSGALGCRGEVAFDDLDLRTPSVQGASRGQAGDAGADNKNANTGTTHSCTSNVVVLSFHSALPEGGPGT